MLKDTDTSVFQKKGLQKKILGDLQKKEAFKKFFRRSTELQQFKK